MIGLLGKKIGMTQFYGDDGISTPITVIQVNPLKVVGVKEISKHGYNAVELGYGLMKKSRINKPQTGRFSKLNMDVPYKLKEFRVDSIEGYATGNQLGLEILADAKFVDVSSTSKGKGFQGVMKRWGAHGGPGGHGSNFHRRPGSIGNCSFPGEVYKNKKLPGHAGVLTKTVQNLVIHSIDSENNLILVKGSIPGANNSIVTIKAAVKKHAK